MKILHLIDSGGLYGAEKVLLELMEEQQHLGLSPTLCSIGDYSFGIKPIETIASSRGLPLEIIRMRPGFNIYAAGKILRYARSNNFEILHSHGYKPNILMGLFPRSIRKIPLICTIHGWTNTKSLSKMTLYEWLDRRLLKYFDAVVVVNKLMVTDPRLISAKVSESRLYVVENGIRLNVMNNHQNNAKSNLLDKFAGGSFIIGAIGRISNEKGYEDLIESVRMLRDKGHDVKAIIIGEGTLLNELQDKVSQLDLHNHVLFPGYMENAKNYFRYFNVFVISSLTEGMPITLLEAMHAGVPVVATRVGGIPDMIVNEKSGYLVPPKEPYAIASAIEHIINNPETIAPLVKNAGERLLQRYSSEIMAKKYMDIYKTLEAIIY